MGVLAIAADGSRIFGGLYSAEWKGIVSVDRSGSITRIEAFAKQDGSFGGAFDGRWLVWSEEHSAANTDDWDIRAWDSTGGEAFVIATAPRVNGATVPGPFVIPVVSQGRAAWVQANQSGKGEVHLYDFATRLDRVLSAGTVVPPVVFWDSKLVWVEKAAPGGGGHLAMADATTGEPLTLPEPLASIHSIATLAASDDLVAWSEDFHTVSIWRVGEPEATKVFADGNDNEVDWIRIAGDLVTWRGATKQWAADLRSRSVAPITKQYGDRLTSGNALLVSQPVGPFVKSEDPLMGNVSEIDLVDVTKLPPLPGCPS